MKTPIVFASTNPRPSALGYLAFLLGVAVLCACIFRVSVLSNRIAETKLSIADIEVKLKEGISSSILQSTPTADPRANAAARLLAAPWGRVLDKVEVSRPTDLKIVDASFEAITQSIELTTMSSNVRSAHEFVEALMLNGLEEARLSSATQISEGEQKGTKSLLTATWGNKP